MLTDEVPTTTRPSTAHASTSEHATFLVDVRAQHRERLAWRTAAVVAVILASGPAWQVLQNVGAAEQQEPSLAAPLVADDPAPVAPSGKGNVTRLKPKVRQAVERAIAAAADDGVDFRVTSGWRSATSQQRLYDEAVAKYGSPAKARQWVLPPAESAHVKGLAVDIGPAAAAKWLDRGGVRYGLCRRYANEPWHFELLAPAKGQDCPALQPHP